MGTVLFACVMAVEKVHLIPGNTWLLLGCWLVPYLVAGYDVLWKAARNIVRGHVFDEDFLMMVATFGAFGCGENAEGVAVMLLFQIGELFQSVAVGKSRESIAKMMDIAPKTAHVLRNGEFTETDPEEVRAGEMILVRPGERVPLDGVVAEGSSFLDTSSLTGESVPRYVETGDRVISGCLNGEGTLRVQVSGEYEDSTVAKVLELLENASSRKAKVENFITRFARWYTPSVTVAAVLLAVLPPLLFRVPWTEWIRRACSFLVISCPCALVISVPLGFFGGIGAAAKKGILVKGSNFFEALANVKTLVFDKTGTLTKGEFSVAEICPVTGLAEDQLLKFAAMAESASTHPVALALRREASKCGLTVGQDVLGNAELREIPGKGIEAVIQGSRFLAGSVKLLADHGIEASVPEGVGTVVYLAVNGHFAGSIRISDSLKDHAPLALDLLRDYGISKTVMLSGDRREAAEAVGRELSLSEVRAELLPGDKVSEFERILEEQGGGDTQSGTFGKKSGFVAYVGDGMNDAPVLGRADVGIAMGSLGSDAAIEAADVVLMDDDLMKLPQAFKIARRTIRIVRQNIVFALTVKGIALILGALGIASMWIAVFADVGVAVIAILNSLRAMKAES